MVARSKRGPFGIYIHEGCQLFTAPWVNSARIDTHTDTQMLRMQERLIKKGLFCPPRMLPSSLLLRLFTPTGPRPAFWCPSSLSPRLLPMTDWFLHPRFHSVLKTGSLLSTFQRCALSEITQSNLLFPSLRVDRAEPYSNGWHDMRNANKKGLQRRENIIRFGLSA